MTKCNKVFITYLTHSTSSVEYLNHFNHFKDGSYGYVIQKAVTKAKQIKLSVSQAFFLGKPMRDAAFFSFFCKPQPQLVSDQKPQASHSRE